MNNRKAKITAKLTEIVVQVVRPMKRWMGEPTKLAMCRVMSRRPKKRKWQSSVDMTFPPTWDCMIAAI